MLESHEAGRLALVPMALELVRVLTLLLVGDGLRLAEVATVAEVLAVACLRRQQRRLLAVIGRPCRIEEDATGSAYLRIVPPRHHARADAAGYTRILIGQMLLWRDVLRLPCQLVALRLCRRDPERLEQLLRLLPRLAWLVLPLLLSRLLILVFSRFSIVGHDLTLRVVDEQSVLVLLCSQLGQCLVFQNRPLDDLHDLGLVEDTCAELRFDEALNLRGAQDCLGRAWLELTRSHISQITRDDTSVDCAWTCWTLPIGYWQHLRWRFFLSQVVRCCLVVGLLGSQDWSQGVELLVPRRASWSICCCVGGCS